MTTDVEICNRALDEIGARVIISSLSENTPQAKVATRQYDPMRKQLLRSAPWGFSRKTDALVVEGLYTDNPPAAPFPWYAKNTYPADCLKAHYILPMPATEVTEGVPVVGQLFAPWCTPSRNYRYIPAYDPGDATVDPVIPPHRVLLTNLSPALLVYTVDVTDPDLFDELFTNALVMALANRFVMPLSGNVKLKSSYAQLAQDAVTQARVADGNEAIPSTDSTPDWIAARGIPAYVPGGVNQNQQGLWFSGYDDINWGM